MHGQLIELIDAIVKAGTDYFRFENRRNLLLYQNLALLIRKFLIANRSKWEGLHIMQRVKPTRSPPHADNTADRCIEL